MKLRSLLIFNFILTASLHVNANNASELSTAQINNMSCGSTSALASNGNRLYLPEDGYVPNEEVAIKIAVAVWTPIYGAKKIAQEKPYKAKLKQDIWHVTGSLRDGLKGGAAEMYLCKYDAKILGVTHGK